MEARGIAASIDDRAERAAALHPVVLAQIGIDPAGARDTIKAFPKLPNKLNYLTALAQAHAASGNVAETERIYAEIVVEDQSSQAGKLAAANALGQVAIAHANKGTIEEAFRTLERLRDRDKAGQYAIVGVVTANLVAAQAKHGDLDGAIKTALSIAGENPHPLMKTIGDRFRNDKADEAQRIIAKLDDGPQRYAQWGVMQAQLELGRLIDAQVTASAIKPGHAKASALLELASYHLEHRAHPLALTLLQEAESSARMTTNEWTRADILWRIAVKTALAGDADHAIAIAKSIEQDGHRRSAIYDIAQAQAKRGEYAAAFNTAHMLKQPPETKDPQVSAYAMAVSNILVEMVKVGKGTEAKDTAARLQDLDIRRAQLYSGIALAYAELGNVKEAKAALLMVDSETQRSVRRKELQQLEDKIRLSRDPAAETRRDEFVRIDLDIQPGLEAIAKALARKGDLPGALAVADQLNHPGRRLELINGIANLHVMSGRKDDTRRWARSLSGPSEKVFALVGIAGALSQQANARKTTPTTRDGQAKRRA